MGGQQVLVGGVVVIGPVGEHVDDAGALVLQDVVVLLLPGLLGEDLRHLVQQVAVGLIPGVVAAVAVAVLELLRQGLAGGGLVVVEGGGGVVGEEDGVRVVIGLVHGVGRQGQPGVDQGGHLVLGDLHLVVVHAVLGAHLDEVVLQLATTVSAAISAKFTRRLVISSSVSTPRRLEAKVVSPVVPYFTW